MSYTSVVIADSPAFYWRFGEATSATPSADASGNGRTGTNTAGGTMTWGRTGLLVTDADTCIQGPSSAGSGNVQVAYGSWMNSASISIEFWMKGTAATVGIAICRDIQTGTRVWQVARNTSGKITFTVISGAVPTATSSASVNDGNAHHIVITYNGTTCLIYIDGALDTTATLSQALGQPTATPITAMNSNRTTLNGWNADIDEVAYYTSVLSATRVSAHYAAGSGNAAGTLASTLAGATLAGSGTVGSVGTTGTLATTLSGATLAASGTETITGTLASTLGGVTLSATGSEKFTGTLASTLAGATLAASGSTLTGITGTLATTLAGATLAASGAETITGTVTTTLAGVAVAASGGETFTGTLTATLAGAALSASGVETVSGTLAVTLDGVSLAAAGGETVSGALVVTLDDATLAATGTTFVNVTGTLSTTLAGATLSADANTHPPFRDVKVYTIVDRSRVVTITDQSRTLTPVEHPREIVLTDRSL